MTEHKIPCAIVRDLLPSYVDGLTSAETNGAVDEHLAQCEACTAALEKMRAPSPDAPDAPEVDYLKKVRRKTNRRSVLIGVCLMVLALGILGYRIFGVGEKVQPEDVNLRVSVNDGRVYLNGTFTGSTNAFARATFSASNEMVDVTVYTAPKTFFNSEKISAAYTSDAPVKQIRMNGLIVWQEGEDIDPMAARLYEAKNPFVGDMPANSALAEILGISDRFGSYTNELQTETAPYGWKIILENAIESADTQGAQLEMRLCAELLLMSVDNLDYVTWEYPSQYGTQSNTISREEYGEVLARQSGDIFAYQARVGDLKALRSSIAK